MQEQQFTLILQTLQQLRDVYGDSVDKVIQGNVSNIVFLKSTDDSMLDTLEKMSGKTHRVYTNSKTITKDQEKIWMQNEGKISYTMSTQEQPVIGYNDMAFISERNSIVFRAGDSPIWNRNETILPMSWRLLQNQIKHAGHNYSLQTIPTLSSALDFDVRANQPDFGKMLDKRMNQAYVANQAKELYQEAYGYSDFEIEKLDLDNYSDEIMTIINKIIEEKARIEAGDDYNEDDYDAVYDGNQSLFSEAEINEEQIVENAKAQDEYDKYVGKTYCDGLIAADSLISMGGAVNHSLDQAFLKVYAELKHKLWNDKEYFVTDGNGGLLGVDGKRYIIKNDIKGDLDAVNQAIHDPKSKLYGDEDIDESKISAIGTYSVTDDFYRFLVSLNKWDFANGEFTRLLARELNPYN